MYRSTIGDVFARDGPKKAGARKPRPGQQQLLLRHLDGNLKYLIRDTQRLTVALEYHESLTQGRAVSQRRVKLPRPKDEPRQMALQARPTRTLPHSSIVSLGEKPGYVD